MVLTALATSIVLGLAAPATAQAQPAAMSPTAAAPSMASATTSAHTSQSAARPNSLPVLGDTNDDVVRLQQAMVARGFTLKGGVDGNFSTRTQATLRNLQKAAQRIVSAHGGEFPRDFAAILELPGVGRYTAGAVACFAYEKPVAAVDTNVARLLSRYFGVKGDTDFARGRFRIRGDTLEIHPAYEELAVRIEFWGDEVDEVRYFAVADQRSLGAAEEGL